jgi:hypothetical protein
MASRPVVTLIFLQASAASALALHGADPVALRPTGDRYLRVAEGGRLRAEALVPGEAETFELARRGDGCISLRVPGGRFLVAEGRHLRVARGEGPQAEPGDRGLFCLVPAGENRVGLRVKGAGEFLVFDGKPPRPADAQQPDQPRSEETIEIFRMAELPADLRASLSAGLREVIAAELTGKVYDKTRTRVREQSLDLPAPTRGDWLRTKPRRIFSVTEEQQVQARLDGATEIEILHMPSLRGHADRGLGLLLFVVRARVPVAGRVRYKVPELASASTGFQAVIELNFRGQVQARKSGTQLSIDPPRLEELRVEFRSLALSNDVLAALRGPIKDLINHELRRNRDLIRHKANQAVAKAFKTREFEHPMLRYLGFP